MTRSAGRTPVLAAVLLAAQLSTSACGAEPLAPDPVPPAAASLETLTIETTRGPAAFRVEIADDEAERQRGLMFRDRLAPDAGMLFIWTRAAPRAFWMKNTLIPLDIIYIGADGRIVSIAAMTEPFSEEPIPSDGPALGVLEIAGGRAAQLGVKPGDRVRHRIFPR
ncbi:MAG: DUF192 domain-containing protein [Pseudomonadota bacterium]